MTIRCVHCSLRLDRIRRHRISDESELSLERIRRWVYPRDVLGTEYICHACWELINQTSEQIPVAQTQGHHNVCVACGRSILRVRSRTILRPEMSERENLIKRIIEEWIQPRELQPQDEVCIPCWLRAQRAAANRQQQNETDVQARQTVSPSLVPEQAVQESIHDQIESQQQNQEENARLTLPTIRRAAEEGSS